MKKTFIIILAILCFAGIGGCNLYIHNINKELYNSGYVNGNSAGNLYNSGLFCEYDGVIYFANPNDNNKLYQMNANGTEVRKISDDSAAFINVDEHYIYYTKSNEKSIDQFSFLHKSTSSLRKMRKDLKGDVVVLDTDPCMYVSLVGNNLYYIHYNSSEGSSLYKIKIDGKEKSNVFPQPYFTCSTDRQRIYYNGLDTDHNVYCFDTSTGVQTLIYEGNCWMPIVEGNDLYFMDCEDNYSLVKVNLVTEEKTILTNDRIDCFNIKNGVVYFQRNGNSSALCSVNTDGSNYTVLKEGVFTEIHTTENYVFFKDYFSEISYQMYLPSGQISVFHPEG